MKKIGFVDYFLSEWHANNYPSWIKEICEEQSLSYELSYAYGEKPSVFDKMTTDQWCEKFGVEKCETIEELCEKSDVIVVLSPSNPEKHLEYAKKVLKYKKPTYIDKTFAPDYATAKEIFDLAEMYETPVFSSSALRYADEIENYRDEDAIITTGGGSSIGEYIVHQAEMVVKVLSAEPKSVTVSKQGNQYICRAEFEGGKKATMIYADPLPFSVCIQRNDGTQKYSGINSPFFKKLIKDMLNLFETGKESFPRSETLYVMKLREAVLKGTGKPDVKIEI